MTEKSVTIILSLNKTPIDFNFEIFDILKNDLFTNKEIKYLEKLNNQYLFNVSKNVSKLEGFYTKREFERLSIEFSWRSSHIEGNTYSYLETEYLLKDNIEPE